MSGWENSGISRYLWMRKTSAVWRNWCITTGCDGWFGMAEENARVSAYRVHRRACDHYWKALGLATPGARGVLVLEDDVVFRDGWVGMLIEVLDEMGRAGLAEFILTLGSFRDHERLSLRRGLFHSRYPAAG